MTVCPGLLGFENPSSVESRLRSKLKFCLVCQNMNTADNSESRPLACKARASVPSVVYRQCAMVRRRCVSFSFATAPQPPVYRHSRHAWGRTLQMFAAAIWSCRSSCRRAGRRRSTCCVADRGAVTCGRCFAPCNGCAVRQSRWLQPLLQRASEALHSCNRAGSDLDLLLAAWRNLLPAVHLCSTDTSTE